MRSVPLLQAIDEAERRGDAEQALQLMLTHPDGLSFWRPRRYTGLMQMSALAGIVPAWATSRWILSQAHQHLGERHDPVARQRFRRALQVAVELRGGIEALPGRDVTDQQCRVVDHDWVFRELYLYDLGGLRHFLQRVATPDLLAGADRVAAWAASPMGGYRFVGGDARELAWEDLADGEVLGTANLGSAVSREPGDCVLGRIVPIDDGVMFEMPPLPVPEPVALRVSRRPQGWLEALRDEPPGLSVAGAGPCSGLLSDVPDELVRQTLSRGRPVSLRTLRDEASYARHVVELGRHLLAGGDDQHPQEHDLWPRMAAVLVDPAALQSLGCRYRALAAGDREVLAALAGRLAEPAASWCHLLARASSGAA
jgi:hypothetical protein